MNRYLSLLIVLLLLTFSASAADRDPLPRPNWNRASAAEAVDVSDTQRTLGELYGLVRAGRGEDLLLQVEAIAQGRDRSDPERDRILYMLAVSLGDLGPGYVEPAILERLAETRSRALVPHEEYRNMGVPLYNIRAAAIGSLAEWQRYEAQVAPATPTGAEQLISELKSASPNVTAEQVRRAGRELTPAEFELVLAALPAMPDPAAASVVLGSIEPETARRPAVTDQLFELLGHHELGAAAALALARSGDEAILGRLADLAGDGQGLASRRASLAIDVYLGSERNR